MAKDFYHEIVKRALIKAGWKITHDPYLLRSGRIGYEIDLGAEKLIGASKDKSEIVVEVKSFVGASNVNEFHRAMGQFNDYFVGLEMVDPERELYIAVPEAIYNSFFQEEFIQRAIKRIEAKFILFDPSTETIVQWIK